MASAPLFGSADDHLLWNGLSFLNQEIARRIPRQPGQILVHATQSANKGHRRGSYEWQQDVFCNLLVRQREVIASILAGLVPKSAAPNDPDDFTIIAQPKILIAANPRKDDHVKPAEKTNKMWISAVTPTRLDTSEGVIAAVLRQYQELNGQVTFSTHVGWVLGLLSDCHAENLEDAAYKTATDALAQYVYLVSYPKMRARLEIKPQSGKDNFFDTITADYTRFSSASLTSPIPEGVAHVLPTPNQSQYAWYMFDDVAAIDGGQWVASKATARDRYHAPLYDVEGRKYFQGMLSVVVRKFKAALDSLSTALAECKSNSWETATTTQCVMDITRKVAEAQKCVTALSTLLTLFARKPFGNQKLDLLSLHLIWLAECAKVQNRSDLPFTTTAPDGTPSPPSNVSPRRHNTFSLALRNTEDDNAGPNFEDIEDADDEYPELEALDELQQLGELNLEDGKADTKPGANGWAAAAHKQLHLGCLHQHSFEHAVPRVRLADMRIKSSHIRNADVQVMDIKFGKFPSKRLSAEKCLDVILEMPGSGKLNREELVDRITAKMQDRVREESSDDALSAKLDQVKAKWLTNTTFGGTMHCKTMIMSIMILARSTEIPESMTTGEWLENNGIFGLKNTIMALVNNPLSLLNVSKRCCPPCENLVKIMIKEGVFEPGKQVDIAYPGYHTKWSASTLPPFLTKTYVDQCLGFAKQDALKKLQELQKRIDEDKTSSKDSASPDSNTTTADLMEDQSHMIMGIWDPNFTPPPRPSKREANTPEPGSGSPSKLTRKKEDDDAK